MNEHTTNRILLVDDNPAIHEDFKKVLGQSHTGSASLASARAAFFGADQPLASAGPTYEIDSAFQGEEALEKVRASLAEGRPYALAFVDVRMPPGLDGVETLARIFGLDARIQAVLCTAYSDYSWDQMLARLGRSDRLLILKKPFDNVEVQQLASALTEKWNAEARERTRIEEARTAEREARAYASSMATMNRALEAARAGAVAGAQGKSELLAQVSREVSNPVNSILTAAELLRVGGLDPDTQRQHAESIRERSQRLLGMLDKVIELSAVDCGRLDAEKRLIPIRPLLSKLIERQRPAARAKSIDLDMSIDPSVPIEIQSDPLRIEQIVEHLVVNAIQFTDKGRVRVGVGLEAARGTEPGKIRIVVEDTGIGISADLRGVLFEAFPQSRTGAENPRPCAGLSLALAHRLARAIGGDLDVLSAPGRGSSFMLSIPLAAPAGLAAGAPQQVGARIRGRILLAEHSLASQRLHAADLRRAGAEVEATANSSEAVALALSALQAGACHDLVILEHRPPSLDGRDALVRLRGAGLQVPIVVIAGTDDAGDRARLLDAGCSEFLVKPLDRERLVAACETWIGPVVRPALPSAPQASSEPRISSPR